jgi:hypothetical protein
MLVALFKMRVWSAEGSGATFGRLKTINRAGRACALHNPNFKEFQQHSVTMYYGST